MPMFYTAFGEQIFGTNHRYGYAGAWQYQAHSFPAGSNIPFLHLGHRHYDPSSGRFLQRDPLGVLGGWNVYAAVNGTPTGFVDPLGLDAEGGVHDLGPLWWHVHHEAKWGGLFIFGNYGAAVGELACAATGFGWAWGTDKFETGDLLKKIGDAMHALDQAGQNSPYDSPSWPPAGDFVGPPAPPRPSPTDFVGPPA